MFEPGNFIIFKCIDHNDTDVKKHNNQFAIITYQKVDTDKEVGKMYHLKFADGYETDAYPEELKFPE